MFTTVKSLPSIWADAEVVEPGLTGGHIVPVLCCPLAAVGAATSLVGAAGETVADNSNDDTAVLQTTYAAAYIAPGRMLGSKVAVRDDASVEELVSATSWA